MRTKLMLMAVLSTALTISSCKKDKYQPKGDYGNANIAHSNTVALSSWVQLSNDGFNYEYAATITWADITQSVYDNGAVIAYFKVGSTWYALPYTYTDDTYSALTLTFGVNVGNVVFDASGYDDSGAPTATDLANAGFVVKIVTISPAGMVAHPNVDLTNFEEVKKEFNLQ